MFERLTDRARKAMALANQEARRFNHEYIGTEHILLGLVKEGSGVAANVLKNLDIDLRRVRLAVEKLIQSHPHIVMSDKLPHTPRAKKAIEYAIEEARGLSHSHVGTEHLLLGLMREGQGIAWQALQQFGLTIEKLRAEVVETLGASGDDDSNNGIPPFELPNRIAHVLMRNDSNLAYLTDEVGSPISPPMRVELANEIVRRYDSP